MASHGKFESGKNGIGKAKFHYEKKSGVMDIVVDVDLSRFKKQFSLAQYKLDSAVMNSMQPFMPMQTGTFINVTRGISAALAGTGTVCAAAPPMGRFLYEGKVMVDSKTKKGPRKIPTGPNEYILRFRKGAKLVAIDKPLKYSTSAHPDATDHWFDKAKEKDSESWVKLVKETAGGG